MKIFGSLSALFFIALSVFAFLGALALFLIMFGGCMICLSYISLKLFPFPIFVEIWLKVEWLWRVLEVSTATDEVKAGAAVVITLTATLLFCLVWIVFVSSHALAGKLLAAAE